MLAGEQSQETWPLQGMYSLIRGGLTLEEGVLADAAEVQRRLAHLVQADQVKRRVKGALCA